MKTSFVQCAENGTTIATTIFRLSSERMRSLEYDNKSIICSTFSLNQHIFTAVAVMPIALSGSN